MERVDRFLASWQGDASQGALIHNPANMFYLSGYTGEGCLFLSGKGRALITDFRYTEQAEQQAPGFQVHMTDKDRTPERVVADLCAQWRLETVLYEDDTLTVKEFAKFSLPTSGGVGDALEQLRQIKMK